MDSAWTIGDICLAPSREINCYVTSKVTNIQEHDGQMVVVVMHRDGSSNGPETVEMSLLLEVPQDDRRPVAWKKDDLCIVRVDRNHFRLAIIDHVKAEVAAVKFLSIFNESISSLERVSIRCLYRVVKKPEPKKKKGLGKKLAFGLAGAVGMAALAPIAVQMAVGALGFGAGGIIAGTPAAAIMASYGGAVTAGSACAIMQSIGAAGLSATGALISATAGGVVGGAAGLAAGAVADRENE